jgi:hypothetical protein
MHDASTRALKDARPDSTGDAAAYDALRDRIVSRDPSETILAPSHARHTTTRSSFVRSPGVRIAAVTVMAAAAVVAATVALPHLGGQRTASVLTPDKAYAKPLLTLATHVAATPLKGDGTLVQHSNAIKGEGKFSGADLYLDNGRYYYAETAAGLPAAVKAGPQDFTLKPAVDAMAGVSSADPQVARAALLKAVNPQFGDDTENEAASRQDNIIWVSGIDVLGAGYGRPDVLAGMLRALATVDGVIVAPGTYDGVRTLEISMNVPEQTSSLTSRSEALAKTLEAVKKAGGTAADQKAQAEALTKKLTGTTATIVTPAHVMRATVDASDGALLRYSDIGLVVKYRVSRVDAADYGAR